MSSINGARKSGQQFKRMRLQHLRKPHIKVNTGWIRDLNIRPDTIKLLEVLVLVLTLVAAQVVINLAGPVVIKRLCWDFLKEYGRSNCYTVIL